MPIPFRCPAATEGDDIDHVVGRRALPPDAAWPSDDDPNPFVRFRTLLYSWWLARGRGMSDDAYVDTVRTLDDAIAEVDGKGFEPTSYARRESLTQELGLGEGGLWIKDETGNVSGSHKARHLMGLAITLAIAEQTGLSPSAEATRELAISSCGNAALAAAVVARAAGRRLRVFVPTWAEPAVVTRLEALGADIEVCEREAGERGDPCYLRFKRHAADGALPFTVQGPDNGLVIEGGMTLGWELVTQHAAASTAPLDRLIVQVGGGALASACVQAIRVAHALGALDRLPVVHAVQTAACQPLVRAWRRVAEGVANRLEAVTAIPAAADRVPAIAAWLDSRRGTVEVAAELTHAAHHRSHYMWPVEEPAHSVAASILDDETYDWLEVVRGMVETGGWPVPVDEAMLVRAHEHGTTTTGIMACPTGTAGLAGAFTLQAAGSLDDGEHVAVLFTGARR